MYSFYIDGDDIKVFMNKLLKEDTFNGFELRVCEIKKNVFISVDGRLNKKWYAEEIKREYTTWSEIRPNIFEFIKGKKAPESIKLVLSLNKNAVEKIHNNLRSCFLNINFEGGIITVVTGTDQKEFSLDKSHNDAWEDSVKRFFKKLGIVQKTE